MRAAAQWMTECFSLSGRDKAVHRRELQDADNLGETDAKEDLPDEEAEEDGPSDSGEGSQGEEGTPATKQRVQMEEDAGRVEAPD